LHRRLSERLLDHVLGLVKVVGHQREVTNHAGEDGPAESIEYKSTISAIGLFIT
jgi:hypothetical protein